MLDNKLAYSPTIGLVESHVGIYKIYVLRNPITEEIFYVGQTMQPLETRLSGHISETGANRDKINYIKSILETGQKPIIEVIETISTKCYIDTMAVNEREIYWIRYHKSLGCNLLNKAATAPDTKCREFHGYLSAIKKGETSWHYYYCGKTAGGYEVYDEAKIKADGFVMRTYSKPDLPPLIPRKEYQYDAFEYEKSRIKLGLQEKIKSNKVFTPADIYPSQPSWSLGFKNGIPPYKSLKVEMYLEMQIDDCDLEDDELENDMADYESTGDEEPDYYENTNNGAFYLSGYVPPEFYYVKKPLKERVREEGTIDIDYSIENYND